MDNEKLKSWVPTIIAAVSVIGFFFTQSARIGALESQADEAKMKNEQAFEVLSQINARLAGLDQKSADIKEDIAELKMLIRRP